MSLAEKLKARKPQEKIVEIDGDKYLVKGLGRVAKNRLYNEASSEGSWDVAAFEGMVLAACVCDPETREPVLPNPDDWDLDPKVTGPLVEACSELLGLSKSETEAVKKSETTESYA
jgi:hypothetical protein